MAAPAVRLAKMERKGGKFVVEGSVSYGHCPVCGSAASAITETVPLELHGVACSCGSKNFRFAINSIKPNKALNPTDWHSS